MPCFKKICVCRCVCECVRKRKPSLDGTYQHEFEIKNENNMKWTSKGAQGAKVTINEDSSNPQLWILEREKTSPDWSFSILSKNGEKLYVSYDDSNIITLELEGTSGKERLFEALLQRDMDFVFRAKDSTDRYIRSNENNELEMVTTIEELHNMYWQINEKSEVTPRQGKTYIVEMQYAAQKWISSNAQNDQPVNVGQRGGLQKWEMDPSAKNRTMRFSAGDNKRASSTRTQNTVVFSGLLNYPNDSYKPYWQGFGCKLKSLSTCEWLRCSSSSVDDNTLQTTEVEKDAVIWQIVEVQIPYQDENGVFRYFPDENENKFGDPHCSKR